MIDRKAIVIKKYENRRLYDSTNSRYINLDEIAQLVKQGRDVKVVDAVSGEDITRVVLTQIIMEDAKEPDSAFPLGILRQMIVASGRATQESALKYMKAMFDMYQNAYRVMSPPLSPFEFMPGSRSRSSASAPARAPQPETRTTEVDELKQRVAELEAQVLKTNKKVRKPMARSGRQRRR